MDVSDGHRRPPAPPHKFFATKEVRRILLAEVLHPRSVGWTLDRTVPLTVASLYGVEVSGWDEGENFFVEKTQLEWDEGTGKRVRLSRPLRKNCIVFLRLLQPLSLTGGHSIAFQAAPLHSSLAAAKYDYQLIQLQPYISSRREALV